jgi:hypothetical protein
MVDYNREYCDEKHRNIENELRHHNERIEELEKIVYNIKALITTIRWLTVTLIGAVISIIVYIVQSTILR